MARTGRVARRHAAGAVVVVIAVAGVVGVLTTQISVTTEAVDASRACGSALDGIVDRTGWEAWLAADLAEPDAALREQLVRTRACPDAVNRRIAAATAFGTAAAVAAAFVLLSVRRRNTPADGDAIVRLGRIVVTTGALLTAGGLVALLFLVADADSTLFLYTDRLVVALAGLIVLVPPMALIAIGRLLTLLGERLEPVAASVPASVPERGTS